MKNQKNKNLKRVLKNKIKITMTLFIGFMMTGGLVFAALPQEGTGLNSLIFGVRSEATGENSVAGGYESKATGEDSIAVGYMSKAKNEGSIALGRESIAKGSFSIALGQGGYATKNDSIAIGRNTSSHGIASVSIGEGTYAEGNQSIAMGLGASASGGTSVSLGFYTSSDGSSSFAVGRLTIAKGNASTAMGKYSNSLGNGSVAVGGYDENKGGQAYSHGSIALGVGTKAGDYTGEGFDKVAGNNESVAIGYHAEALGDKAMTLGYDIKTDGEKIFVLGSNIDATGISNAIILGDSSTGVDGALSIGSKGKERQIKFVKSGVDDTDAVNVSQLKEETGKIVGGITASMAIAGIPQVSGDKLFSVGAGTAYYGNHGAIAIGISGQDKNKNIIYKVAGTVDFKGSYGFNAGINYNIGQVNTVKSESDYDELKKKNKELENKLNNLSEKFDKLANLKTTETINNYKEPMKIVIKDFKFDSHILTDFQKEIIISNLNEIELAKKIEIIGYTDIKGSDKYNLKLGLLRASEVASFILSKDNKLNLIIKSKGFNEITNQEANYLRRVEIVIHK